MIVSVSCSKTFTGFRRSSSVSCWEMRSGGGGGVPVGLADELKDPVPRDLLLALMIPVVLLLPNLCSERSAIMVEGSGAFPGTLKRPPAVSDNQHASNRISLSISNRITVVCTYLPLICLLPPGSVLLWYTKKKTAACCTNNTQQLQGT
jgi:hypothetical protein